MSRAAVLIAIVAMALNVINALPMIFSGKELYAATKVNNFNYFYVTTPIVSHDPDSTIVFVPNESMHIAAVEGAVSLPAVGTIGLYLVKTGLPCRDPASNAPNGVAIFDQTTTPRTVFDVSHYVAPPAKLPLSKVAGALSVAPGSMICMIDETQVDMTVRANLTISLGP